MKPAVTGGRARGQTPGLGWITIGPSCTAPPGAPSLIDRPGRRVAVEAIESQEEFGAVAATWRELEGASVPLNPFLTWAWQQAWWEVFGAAYQPCLLVVREGELILGLVPLCRSDRDPGTLQLAGGLTLSDRLGFLHRPGREDEVALAALEWVSAGSPAGTELDLHFLPEGSAALAALRRQSAALGWRLDQEPEEVCPGLELPGDFAAYLSGSLNKKDRHELRRKFRRLDQERPGWRMVGPPELGLDQALEAFLRLLAASGSHKEEFLVPEVRRFFKLMAARLEERGWLRLQLLVAGDDQLAGIFGFTVGGTWHLYNSGYDPVFQALSPGLLCVAEGIRGAITEGCTRADLLRGSENYKYHLGAHDEQLLHLRLAPGVRL
ncbi:MAG: GNAT family N-acetyltransferase [Candidatus Dormibacteria bacterium]